MITLITIFTSHVVVVLLLHSEIHVCSWQVSGFHTVSCSSSMIYCIIRQACITISGTTGTRNPVPGFRVPIVPWRNGWKTSGTRLSLIFYHIGWFFKVEHMSSKVVLYFENSSNMAKMWQKMKKSLVQLAFIPFFGWFWVSVNWISGTHSTTNKYKEIFAQCYFELCCCWRSLAKPHPRYNMLQKK